MPRQRNIGKVEPVKKIWLNASEAKAYLGCSDDFLQKLRDEALIKFSRFGNKMYWYEIESINKFLENNNPLKHIQ